MLTLSITGIDLWKFLCPSAKCHFMMISLVCCVLWVQQGLLGLFLFYSNCEFILIYCMHSDTNFFNASLITRESFPCVSWRVQLSTPQTTYALFRGHVYCQKWGLIAFLCGRFEPVLLILTCGECSGIKSAVV